MRASIVRSIIGLALGLIATVSHAQSVETIAGNGTTVAGPDGTLATAGGIDALTDVAVTPDGRVFYAAGGRLRVISTSGVVTTLPGVGPQPIGPPVIGFAQAIAADSAGNPCFGAQGDGGPALQAGLSGPEGVAVDGAGNVYIADTRNGRIRRVAAATGTISTVAGYTIFPGGSIYLSSALKNVAATNLGVLYAFVQTPAAGLSRLALSGPGELVAPTAPFPGAVDPARHCVVAPAAQQQVFGEPVFGPDGTIYIANDTCVSRLSPRDGLAVVAGSSTRGFSNGDGTLASAQFSGIVALDFDTAGRVYVADRQNNRIRRISGIGAFVNSAPRANAGDDQTAVVGDPVSLSAAASTDPDGDPLRATWTLDSRPAGSTVEIGAGGPLFTNFFPDVPGTYVVRAEVTDGVVSDSDTLQVRVVSVAEFVQGLISSTSALVAALPNEAFAAPGHRNAIQNALADISAAVAAGQVSHAIKKIDALTERTDGCIYIGAPQANGPSSDWVVDCGAQVEILTLLSQMRLRLAPNP